MYLVYNLIGYVKHDAAKEEATWKDLDKACEPLDQHLASRTFFVGDNVTLADIIIMTQFMGLWLVVSLPSLPMRISQRTLRSSSQCLHSACAATPVMFVASRTSFMRQGRVRGAVPVNACVAHAQPREWRLWHPVSLSCEKAG